MALCRLFQNYPDTNREYAVVQAVQLGGFSKENRVSSPFCLLSPGAAPSPFPFLRTSRVLLSLRVLVFVACLDWNSDKTTRRRECQPLPLLDHCLRTVNSPLGTPIRPSEVWSLSWKREPFSIPLFYPFHSLPILVSIYGGARVPSPHYLFSLSSQLLSYCSPFLSSFHFPSPFFLLLTVLNFFPENLMRSQKWTSVLRKKRLYRARASRAYTRSYLDFFSFFLPSDVFTSPVSLVCMRVSAFTREQAGSPRAVIEDFGPWMGVPRGRAKLIAARTVSLIDRRWLA